MGANAEFQHLTWIPISVFIGARFSRKEQRDGKSKPPQQKWQRKHPFKSVNPFSIKLKNLAGLSIRGSGRRLRVKTGPPKSLKKLSLNPMSFFWKKMLFHYFFSRFAGSNSLSAPVAVIFYTFFCMPFSWTVSAENPFKISSSHEKASTLSQEKSALTATNAIPATLYRQISSQGPRIKSLSIKGNKIIETKLIQSHIQLKKGEFYRAKTVQKDVRRLFSLGFFDDISVQLERDGSAVHLIYQVRERKPVAGLEFEGNDSINTQDLKELSLIEEHSFLNFELLTKTLSAIKKKYREKGFYLAEISYKTKKPLCPANFSLS